MSGLYTIFSLCQTCNSFVISTDFTSYSLRLHLRRGLLRRHNHNGTLGSSVLRVHQHIQLRRHRVGHLRQRWSTCRAGRQATQHGQQEGTPSHPEHQLGVYISARSDPERPQRYQAVEGRGGFSFLLLIAGGILMFSNFRLRRSG